MPDQTAADVQLLPPRFEPSKSSDNELAVPNVFHGLIQPSNHVCNHVLRRPSTKDTFRSHARRHVNIRTARKLSAACHHAPHSSSVYVPIESAGLHSPLANRQVSPVAHNRTHVSASVKTVSSAHHDLRLALGVQRKGPHMDTKRQMISSERNVSSATRANAE